MTDKKDILVSKVYINSDDEVSDIIEHFHRAFPDDEILIQKVNYP